jgi:hypothetical protein
LKLRITAGVNIINTTALDSFVRKPSTFMRIADTHPRVHAKRLDKILGFKIPKIEVKLLQKYRAYDKVNDASNKKQHYQGTQTWIGLHPQALQTPYNDIFDALYLLKDFDVKRVVDIGAGYGRVGIVMNCLFPNAYFIGLEILKPRKVEGNRVFEQLELDNCEILLKNVLDDDFNLPTAQIYFIYDFSELDDICKILDELTSRMEKYDFFLITKGERVNYLLEHKYKKFWITNGFLSTGELKIYSSTIDLRKFQHRSKNGHRKSKVF